MTIDQLISLRKKIIAKDLRITEYELDLLYEYALKYLQDLKFKRTIARRILEHSSTYPTHHKGWEDD
jgi:hypothetical protein